MAEVIAPSGDLCALVPHRFELSNADNAVTVEWVVLQPLPAGVSEDDIVFSAPNSLITEVTFPTEGNYNISAIVGVQA